MYQVAWQLSQPDMDEEVDMSAVAQEERGELKDHTRVLAPLATRALTRVSACPEDHPLPTLPTRWFDGVAWHDGREVCRHCYEAHAAMDQAC
jgi:hypothetical protein